MSGVTPYFLKKETFLKNLEETVKNLFKEIMRQCKAERRAKNDITFVELSQKIGKAPGYTNAFENARTFPSIKTFLNYLITNNFDVEPLKRLRITMPDESNKEAGLKLSLCDKIMMMEYDGVAFLSDQVLVFEKLKDRSKTAKEG